MKCVLSLYCLLFLSFKSFSQNFSATEIDSMLTIVEKLDKKDYSYGVTLSLKAYDDSKKIDYKYGMLYSLLLVSREQYELNKFEDALKNASEAENISFFLKDDKSHSDALRLKGISLIRLQKNLQGRRELDKALISAMKLNDAQTKMSRLGVIYNDIAFSIDENGGNLDSVTYFYGKGYREFERMALNNLLKNKMLSLACSNVGSGFLRSRQLDSAQFYLDRAQQLANAVDHKIVIATTANDLGSLYYLKKNYDASLSHFKKGISVAQEIENPHVLKSLYLGISKTYKKIDDGINSGEYLNKYIVISDSLEKSGDLEYSDKQILEKERIIANPKIANRSTFFVLFLSIMVCLLAYFVLSKIVKKKEIKPKPEEIVILNVQVDEHHLRRLAFLASENDPSFLGLFKDTYPVFFKKLNEISPGLIAGEQNICALLKLDLTTKQIAQYTNSTVRAVEAKKYRIRKKLNIPSEEDINIWMMNL